MRTIAALFCLVVLASTGSPQAAAQETATIEAVNQAAAALDEAFERQDARAIEGLLTPDHVAVTYYYREPQSVAEQIASLPDLKYTQTNVTEPHVTLLGPDAAMRSFTAKLDGTFKGRSLTSTAFVTAIMVRRGDKWLETFYQATALGGGGSKKRGCKGVAGTYLTKNAAKDGSLQSRSLLSLVRGGVAAFTDSGEGGETGFAPFTGGRGAWRCEQGEDGAVRLKVTTLDFTTSSGGAAPGLGRLDFDLGYDSQAESISGTATLYLVPLDGDPLAPKALKDGRAFTISGARVEVP